MENTVRSDELQHHGIKGMRWGIRRYQNKDGSLTPAGQKRYNKEVEKLKAETEKVKAAEKVAANRKKTQTKLDKLEAEKQKLEERKKALKKGDAPDDESKKTPEETPEQRRERLLKSSDPKELYEGKDALTTFELNERLQRIDLEARLQGKIPVEQVKTGMDRMNEWRDKINTATNLYKSVDNAFDTVAKSNIGKTLANTLGIDLPKDNKKNPYLDYDGYMKNIENKTPEDFNKFANFWESMGKAERNKPNKTNSNKTEKSEKSNDETNAASKEQTKEDKKASKGQKAAKEQTKDEKKPASEDKRHSEKTSKTDDDVEYAKTDGKVYGEGTSKSSWTKRDNSRSNNDDIIDTTYTEIVDESSRLGMSNVTSTSSYSTGRSYVTNLLPGPTVPSTTRTSQANDDYAERARKAAEELSKAAKKSNETVNNIDIDDDFVQRMLKRNDDLLK